MADHDEKPTQSEDAGPQPARPGDTASTVDPLRRSRTSGIWFAVVAMAVILLLLIIFIAQNTESVQVAFLGWDGTTPLAVALLIAVLAGLLLAVAAGSLRILQLRRRVRRGRSHG